MKPGVNFSEIKEYHTHSDSVTYSFPVEKNHVYLEKRRRKANLVSDFPLLQKNLEIHLHKKRMYQKNVLYFHLENVPRWA